ncbi:citrate synthase [Trichloromonas sp.]|uniref:citrate synthase n=1 Tax=Trichloromonas sp. TaxID=3069249 RepID=UPI003D8159F0
MSSIHGKVRRREETFTQRPMTKIWKEKASSENPYIAEDCSCHGYNLFDLMEKRSFVDVLFLLFQGELPSVEKAQLLEQLMIALINPGPRHPATRAAMCVGVGKTDTTQILPVALTTLSGRHLGAAEIEESMRFLRKEIKNDPNLVSDTLFAEATPPTEGDWHVAPGFGCRFGGIDKLPQKQADKLSSLPAAGKCLAWGQTFAKALNNHGHGWLATGLAAAIFADLGIQPRFGPGLFQLLSAPGMLVHGMEFANKPLTALPFIKDEDYFIER